MILARNYDTKEMFTGNNYWRSFLYSYRQALGDFDTDQYSDTDEYYLYAVWFLNTMVTLIIFLNLLIAIMGDTFDRVQEAADSNMLKELTSIMAENEILFNRSIVFKNAKYIIVVQEEKNNDANETWEGKLQYLKNVMDKNYKIQEETLKHLKKNIKHEILKNVEEISVKVEVEAEAQYKNYKSRLLDVKNIVNGKHLRS